MPDLVPRRPALVRHPLVAAGLKHQGFRRFLALVLEMTGEERVDHGPLTLLGQSRPHGPSIVMGAERVTPRLMPV